jgi:Ca2+-binding RTX toxin-like protein
MIAVASTLIASMLLGAALISNVYAKTGNAEQSKYNLDENCLDDHKGKQVTLTGSRSLETIDTDTDQQREDEIDTDATPDDDVDIVGPGEGLGVIDNSLLGNGNPNVAFEKSENHIEVPDIFFPVETVTIDPDDPSNSTFTVGDPEAMNSLIKTKSDIDTDDRIKDTEKFKKSFPLKERREFNVCGLPMGNIVDGFDFNEIDGTKKSDILLGTSSADDMSGKGSGDVIQGRDDDDIMHGGAGDDSIQGGFGNDNIHGDDGDDAIFAGPNDDYLNGGNGNDELYAQDGDDTLEGGPGANFFDCGSGFDTVVDFDPSKGDVTNDNCEDVRTAL